MQRRLANRVRQLKLATRPDGTVHGGPDRATGDPDTVNRNSAMYGTPDQIAEKLDELRRAGVGYVLINGGGSGGGARGRTSLRRFAAEVMPHFLDAAPDSRPRDRRRNSGGKRPMKIHNLYTDENGESHFRDIEIEWAENAARQQIVEAVPATGVIFRETEAEHNVDWHPAPRRQYIVNLDAGVKITASDGESRFIAAGDVILVEDTTGKGHLSDHIEGKIRHSLFIPIE